MCTVDSGISDYITKFPVKLNPMFDSTRYWINPVNSGLHCVCVCVCGGGGGGGNIGCTIYTVRDVRSSLGSDKTGVFTLPSLFCDPVDLLGIAYGETSLIRHSMEPENSV